MSNRGKKGKRKKKLNNTYKKSMYVNPKMDWIGDFEFRDMLFGSPPPEIGTFIRPDYLKKQESVTSNGNVAYFRHSNLIITTIKKLGTY